MYERNRPSWAKRFFMEYGRCAMKSFLSKEDKAKEEQFGWLKFKLAKGIELRWMKKKWGSVEDDS